MKRFILSALAALTVSTGALANPAMACGCGPDQLPQSSVTSVSRQTWLNERLQKSRKFADLSVQAQTRGDFNNARWYMRQAFYYSPVNSHDEYLTRAMSDKLDRWQVYFDNGQFALANAVVRDYSALLGSYWNYRGYSVELNPIKTRGI